MLAQLKNHKAPLAVTAIGLVVVLVLGVTPLINWNTDDGAPKETVAAAQVSAPAASASSTADLSTLEARIASLELSTNRRLDSLELQVQNLNSAAGRLVTRINRLQNTEQAEFPIEAVNALTAQAKSFDAQLLILNKAVTRLHSRYRSVQSETAAQTQRIDEFAKVSEGLKEIFDGGSNAN